MNRLGMLVDLTHVSADTMRARARRSAGAGDLLALLGARAGRPSAQRARRRAAPGGAQRRRGDGQLQPRLRIRCTQRAGRRTRPPSRRATAAPPYGGLYIGQPERAKAALKAWEQAHPEAARDPQRRGRPHRSHPARSPASTTSGIGSDFDGIEEVPVGLEDVSKFPQLFAELARRGWSDADLAKLAGGNLLRALAGAEQAAAQLRKQRQASGATIANSMSRSRRTEGEAARASLQARAVLSCSITAVPASRVVTGRMPWTAMSAVRSAGDERRRTPPLRPRPLPASSRSECRSSSAALRIAPIGIGDALAGDVGRRAVDRFVQPARAVAERGRGQQAERAGQHRGLVGQDVAEHVLGDRHVEVARAADQVHRRRVDQHVLELHVGKLVAHRRASRDLAPQARGLEHVGLVDRRELARGARAPAAPRRARCARSPRAV